VNVREHYAVTVLREEARGCGYRKPGGVYLVGDGPSDSCGRLPLPCDKCPCCGAGIKPARGWTWIDLRALVADADPCRRSGCAADTESQIYPDYQCPLDGHVERAGLIWVGTQHYKDPATFLQEAQRMGVSRRLRAVPKDFKVGETWVLLAHRNHPVAADGKTADVDEGEVGEAQEETKTAPMIFSVFRPMRIEQVLRGDETVEEIDALVKREIRPVVIERIGEQTAIPATKEVEEK